MIYDNSLIYDIETKTFGKPNSEKDIFKVFGCYSYLTKKYYILTKFDDVKKILSKHKYLIGFNNISYDNPILKRIGFNLNGKIFIDLRGVFVDRAGQMKIKEGMLKDLIMSYSLDEISKLVGVVNDKTGKSKIDYNLFKKDSWTDVELKEIEDYTKRDIEVTKKLYEWVEEYFSSLKDFLKEKDIINKTYLTRTAANVAYKAICKDMNWQEDYGKGILEEENISGGYVAYPANDIYKDDNYLFDFASLYPHIMIQCNLYGRRQDLNSDRLFWTGGNKWKIEGAYYSDKLASVGELLKKWFSDRDKYKKENNPKEYMLKILLNITYGVLDNPAYSLVYDPIAAGDCTRIGRQWIQYVRRVLKQNGYINCYSDTDSIFVHDKFKDKQKLIKLINKCVDDIKQTVPFPQDTFNMKLEDEIKYLFFFKGDKKDKDVVDDFMEDEDDKINKTKQLMKKNYIYVTKEGKVVIKNLGIRKKSNSPISRKIFWEYLLPKIKEGQIKFSKAYLRNIIQMLLEKEKGYKLCTLRKDVGELEQYNKSPTGLQAQITKRYGSGIHFLIPNTRNIGVGIGKSYCTIEEFEENNLKWTDIDLDNLWKELKYFIQPLKVVTIFDFKK